MDQRKVTGRVDPRDQAKHAHAIGARNIDDRGVRDQFGRGQHEIGPDVEPAAGPIARSDLHDPLRAWVGHPAVGARRSLRKLKV